LYKQRVIVVVVYLIILVSDNWQLTWKEKADDEKYRTRIASVKPAQVEQVKVLIAGNVELETILAYLRGSM
jgi:hypothetical protein